MSSSEPPERTLMKPLHLIDKAFLLKKMQLFSSLDLDLLLTIADKMETHLYKKEASIFQEGQEAHRLYLIVEGGVGIKNRKEGVLGELAAGDFFGEESIFNEKERGYEAFCKTDVTLLTMTGPHFLSLINECPTVAISLLEIYTAPLDFRQRD